MSCFRIAVSLDTRNSHFIHVSGVVRYRAAIAKDTMGLESEQLSPAARMLQEIMANKTAENDPYLYLDPHPRVSHFPPPGGVLLVLSCPAWLEWVRARPYVCVWVYAQTGSRGTGVVRQHKPFDDAIAFAIGGGNYIEHEQVLRLVRTHCPSRECAIAMLSR